MVRTSPAVVMAQVPLLLTMPFAATIVLLDRLLGPTTFLAIAGEVLAASLVYLATVGLYLAFLRGDRGLAQGVLGYVRSWIGGRFTMGPSYRRN